MDRESILNGLFLPHGVYVGGKELFPFSYGRLDTLSKTGNILVNRESTRNQGAVESCVELVMLCTMTKGECVRYAHLSHAEKCDMVSEFAESNENDLQSALFEIEERIKHNQLAQMESSDSSYGGATPCLAARVTIFAAKHGMSYDSIYWDMERGAVVQLMAAAYGGNSMYWAVAHDLTKTQETQLEQSNENIDEWLKAQQ